MLHKVNIHGLSIPEALLELVANGRWKCPKDIRMVDKVFPERVELHLYSLEYMSFENKHWIEQVDSMFIGEPDKLNSPGDIDPHLSLLIGDLGIGYDQPIALDYRISQDNPRVLTLKWSSNGQANRWIEIAPDVQHFAHMLGL